MTENNTNEIPTRRNEIFAGPQPAARGWRPHRQSGQAASGLVGCSRERPPGRARARQLKGRGTGNHGRRIPRRLDQGRSGARRTDRPGPTCGRDRRPGWRQDAGHCQSCCCGGGDQDGFLPNSRFDRFADQFFYGVVRRGRRLPGLRKLGRESRSGAGGQPGDCRGPSAGICGGHGRRALDMGGSGGRPFHARAESGGRPRDARGDGHCAAGLRHVDEIWARSQAGRRTEGRHPRRGESHRSQHADVGIGF